MRCNRFCFARSLQHEQLRQDGNRLKPDRKGPKNLQPISFVPSAFPVCASYLIHSVFIWKQDRQHRARAQQVLDLECIQVRVMSRLIIVQHQVYGIRRRRDEDDLEDGVIERIGFIEGPEQIHIASYVNGEVEELTFERDTGGGLRKG